MLHMLKPAVIPRRALFAKRSPTPTSKGTDLGSTTCVRTFSQDVADQDFNVNVSGRFGDVFGS